ncbi:magnesium transporter [Pseudonocardia acaciae]|uniref:magnesium transporter n=1 Tax=Pseudonocardia acaciae TaxID=551276 RepID=UPI000AA118EF|nr:magnesium transporter [Pseudonocardia acaciae]
MAALTRGPAVCADAPAPAETAAAHLSANVPVVGPSARAGEVLDGLRGHRFDSASVVAVCTDGRLAGLVGIERLLAAPPTAPVTELMDPRPPMVGLDTDQERAAWQAVHHGQAALAVVDSDGGFRGIVPPHRLLAVLLAEHDEDLARLGGFLASGAEARTAATETVSRRLWHRLPWLLAGLAGALVSALIVSSFERQLTAQMLIAFFVPGVVYLADAVGTQTEALIIRGLSVGVRIHRVAASETLTGVVLGLLFAVLSYPLVLGIWGEPRVAAAVSVALLAACSIATLIAMVLPWLFHRMGRDPAFGSGPLATVVQDLLSILIYFVAATAIAT